MRANGINPKIDDTEVIYEGRSNTSKYHSEGVEKTRLFFTIFH